MASEILEREQATLDPEKLNAFMGKMLGDMGAAISGSLVILGERLGLYAALQTHGPATSIDLADANGLKSVNDTLGHAEGDRFLRLIARCLVIEFARLPGSLVARVGGDEFCVVVVGPPVATVLSVATGMVRASYRVGLGGGVACGVAAAGTLLTGPMRSPTELFQAADRAQYAAKRLGARYAVPAGEEPDIRTA